MTYVRTLKRIRQDKTNYHKRAALIIGRHSFVTIKVSDQNVAAQILRPAPTGDIVIASAHSRELAKKHGWKGSLNSLPACYLTGLLIGKKALEKGTRNAILYIGKDKFTTRVAACLKGVVDAGVAMPVSEDSLPDGERITGQHIADYASSLKQDQQEYSARFSALLKAGLHPEDYPSHFEEVRFKISGKPSELVSKKSEEGEKDGKDEAKASGGKEKKGAKGKKEADADAGGSKDKSGKAKEKEKGAKGKK